MWYFTTSNGATEALPRWRRSSGASEASASSKLQPWCSSFLSSSSATRVEGVLVELDAGLGGLEQEVAAAGLVAEPARRARCRPRRIDVLVGGGELADGVDVRAALWANAAAPTHGRRGSRSLVRDAVDEAGERGEALERGGGDAGSSRA
jgi:hypothetical protein